MSGTPGVAVSGTQAFIADGEDGLTVFNVATPTAPHLSGTQALGGNSWDVLLSGQNLFLASEAMLNVVNLTAPTGSSLPPE